MDLIGIGSPRRQSLTYEPDCARRGVTCTYTASLFNADGGPNTLLHVRVFLQRAIAFGHPDGVIKAIVEETLKAGDRVEGIWVPREVSYQPSILVLV